MKKKKTKAKQEARKTKRTTGASTKGARAAAASAPKRRSAAKTKRAGATRAQAARKPAKRGGSERARLERNKRLVLEFYDLAINKKDFEAASKYMAPRYIQHNPTAADGHEGLKAYLEWFKRDFPDLKADIKRVVAEGDYVVLHVHGTRGPDPHGTAVIDVFRVENGKVAEHWDVIQAIPPAISNPNGMF